MSAVLPLYRIRSLACFFHFFLLLFFIFISSIANRPVVVLRQQLKDVGASPSIHVFSFLTCLRWLFNKKIKSNATLLVIFSFSKKKKWLATAHRRPTWPLYFHHLSTPAFLRRHKVTSVSKREDDWI